MIVLSILEKPSFTECANPPIPLDTHFESSRGDPRSNIPPEKASRGNVARANLTQKKLWATSGLRIEGRIP